MRGAPTRSLLCSRWVLAHELWESLHTHEQLLSYLWKTPSLPFLPVRKVCGPYGEGFRTVLYDAEGPGVGLGLLFYRLICTILPNQKQQSFLMSLRGLTH